MLSCNNVLLIFDKRFHVSQNYRMPMKNKSTELKTQQQQIGTKVSCKVVVTTNKLRPPQTKKRVTR